ncbi:MAG: hypothetical protein ACTHK3_03245 [Solirubrobacterales bacterium]
MKKRFLIVVTLAAAAFSVAGAPTASAATVIGDQCSATETAEGLGVFEFSAPGNPLSTAAAANGIVTSWSVNSSIPAAVPTVLKVVRVTGPKQLFIAGESAVQNVSLGANTFPTRIPIQAGDRVGLAGASEIGVPFCETPGEKGLLGIFLNAGTGSTTPFEPQSESEARIPVTATIEPDADNDGFGDETQDACPQSAATQAACPTVTLNVSATATKKLVTLLVTGPIAANVTVNGVVSLGKGKKATLKGGTKAIAPGAFTKFKLKFSSALVKRLKELPPSKKLTLKVTSSAPNIVGAPTVKAIKVKLKGQG